MLIKQKKSWEISENEVTDYAVWANRREFLKSMGILGGAVSAGIAGTSLSSLGAAFAAPITGFLRPEMKPISLTGR